MRKNDLVLFVCGPDKCGKTNIIERLSNEFNIPSFKASDEHRTFLKNQKEFLYQLRYSDFRTYDLVSQLGLSVLFDRGYPCEKVYAEFFGRQTDIVALEALDAMYAQLGAKILLCTRHDFTGIIDDLDQRLDSNALEKISNLYHSFAQWTKCETFTLYVDDEDIDREIKEIKQWLA